MKVLILGSGVLGVTTAYVLASRGHAVEIIERQDKSGAETSFANGGQLSYSHAEPWATPGVLRKLPKWLLHSDSPLIFRLRADLDMVEWGLRFLSQCTPARADKNAMDILRLGLYSRLKMREIVEATRLPFDYAERGVLHFCGNEGDMRAAEKQAAFQAKFGCEQRILTRDEVLALEPALQATQRPIVGGVHSHMDAMGDAHAFCLRMAEYCTRELGAKFHFGTTVRAIAAENGNIVSVTSDLGEHTADAYVMALGSYSPLYLKGLGIRVPIYPMKGYSITVPANDAAPSVSVTDGSYKIVFSRLGDRLRVAGTAEFAGYDESILPQRVEPIIKAARSLFPGVDWNTRLHEWACLRPSTPTGVPILGKTPLANLYLNTGHGTLGWTQAAGSAYIVADIMEGRSAEITLNGLTLA